MRCPIPRPVGELFLTSLLLSNVRLCPSGYGVDLRSPISGNVSGSSPPKQSLSLIGLDEPVAPALDHTGGEQFFDTV